MIVAEAENNLIQGQRGAWEVIIGMEIHAQVISKSKLFSSAVTGFGAEPNTQVSLVDAAMPGMLPVLNRFCVEQAIRTGFGLNAKINLFSVFDRKNYFYPDLPAGYQISQYHYPIVGEGWVMIDLPNGTNKKIEVERLHLEQDAGKSLHDQHPHDSYIDLNRCGVGLMEIVSKPDLRSSEEATLYLKKLRSILRYLETCDCNMEQGSLRADVNVSVRQPGKSLGTRCEIKNVNSIRFVQQAIDYEARRQIETIENGGTVEQHTMLFDPDTGTTHPMRSKEEAHDYRYFPDPDLLPLVLHEDEVHTIQAALPELPDAKKHRFMDDYGLSNSDSDLLVAEREVADFFEVIAQGRDAKTVANWVVGPVFAALHKAGLHIVQSPVSTDHLGELLDLVAEGILSGRLAKEVFEIMWETGKPPAEIVEEKGLKQISDVSSLEKAVQEVLKENPTMVTDYKAGKEKLFGFFVGQVMKKTQGQANPGIVNEILRKALK